MFSFEEELAPGGRKVCTARILIAWSNSFVMIQIVEGVSAVIGDAHERRDTIHVKFSGVKDDGYRKVLHAIKVLLPEKLHSGGQSMWTVQFRIPLVNVNRQTNLIGGKVFPGHHLL